MEGKAKDQEIFDFLTLLSAKGEPQMKLLVFLFLEISPKE